MVSAVIIENRMNLITTGMKTLSITNGTITAVSIKSVSFSVKPNHNLYSSISAYSRHIYL